VAELSIGVRVWQVTAVFFTSLLTVLLGGLAITLLSVVLSGLFGHGRRPYILDHYNDDPAFIAIPILVAILAALYVLVLNFVNKHSTLIAVCVIVAIAILAVQFSTARPVILLGPIFGIAVIIITEVSVKMLSRIGMKGCKPDEIRHLIKLTERGLVRTYMGS
jgi:hypothetical protein